MYHNVIFDSPGPEGQILNPDLKTLKLLIKYGQASYWAGGSGESMLTNNNSGTELVFYRHKELGYHFLFDGGNNNLWRSKGVVDIQGDAVVYIGGNPFTIPKYLFIDDMEDACEIIEEFIHNGKEPPKVIDWISENKLKLIEKNMAEW